MQLNSTRLPLILILSCSITHSHCIGQDPGRRGKEKPVDETGKVFPGLGTMIVHRDEVASRFAFVALGEHHYVGKTSLKSTEEVPILHPFYAIRVSDRKQDFGYTAFALTNWGLQNWKELIRYRGKLKIAKGLINKDFRYIERPQGLPERRFMALNYFAHTVRLEEAR